MSDHQDPYAADQLRSAIDQDLVERLVAGQFPQWAELPVRPVATSGWDNRTFHLGDALSVRLPSGREYAEQVDKEHRWLPRLAPQLPITVSQPLEVGAPAEGYPFGWSIYRWLPGETALASPPSDLTTFATEVGAFVAALHRIDPTGGPPPGGHNFGRGGPLSVYDAQTRTTIETLGDRIDGRVALAAWEESLAAVPADDRPPVWVHGDVAVGNLLLDDHHRLSAVIDFGCMAIGDPACDLVLAWTLFEDESRAAFQDAIDLDHDTWLRGRGWAEWKALITLDGDDEAGARRSLDATLTEFVAS